MTMTPVVSAQEAKQLLKKGALLFDVREQNEWNYGHLKDAKHAAISSITPDNIKDKFPKDKVTLFVCATGIRSGKVAKFLKQNGYNKAFNVQGGTVALRQELKENVPVMHN